MDEVWVLECHDRYDHIISSYIQTVCVSLEAATMILRRDFPTAAQVNDVAASDPDYGFVYNDTEDDEKWYSITKWLVEA